MELKLRRWLYYNLKLKECSQKLRRNMTSAEKKIWYELLRTLPFHFYRQKPIDNFIADFYCPKLKLVIEIDGSIHFTDEQKKYDEQRTKVLEGYGLDVIRFTNNEVLKNFDGVCNIVMDLIKTRIKYR